MSAKAQGQAAADVRAMVFVFMGHLLLIVGEADGEQLGRAGAQYATPTTPASTSIRGRAETALRFCNAPAHAIRVIGVSYDRAGLTAPRTAKDVAMKSLILALSVALVAAGMAPSASEAKRVGGGSSAGMQRSLPPRATPEAAPAKPAQAAPATPAAAAAPAPVAAPKRSWMGPLAGLAAGLGLAALMSHFGMGAEFGNIIMMVLLALVAFVAIRFVMSRFGRANAQPSMATPNGLQFAGAGGASPTPSSGSGWGATAASAPAALPAAVASTSPLPEGFDAPAFERVAKMIFIRLQAANDSSDLNDLRSFTTPEMFASIRLELQERGSSAQQTDVVKIDAEVLDFATEPERQVVSVRFHGLIREDKDGVAAPFDEVWHMVKPLDGSREWAIAGIQQSQSH